MREHGNVSIEELPEHNVEISKLEENNAYLKKIVVDLLVEKIHVKNHSDVVDLKAKVTQLEGFNWIILKRNNFLTNEINELKADIEAKDAYLETFKLKKLCSKEVSQ